MDRNPSPPAPRVYTEAQPSTIFVYADTEKFMEMVRRFTGQTAPTNAAGSAHRGATVPPPLALEPVQQHQSVLATATAPRPRVFVFGSELTLSPPFSSDNPCPSILNKAPDPLLLPVEVEAEEVEMEDAEEAEAIKEGRFYQLPPPPGRNADAGEPKLLILFPLAPSSTQGN